MLSMPGGGSRNICTVCIAISLYPHDPTTQKKGCLLFLFCPKKHNLGNEEPRKRLGNGQVATSNIWPLNLKKNVKKFKKSLLPY